MSKQDGSLRIMREAKKAKPGIEGLLVENIVWKRILIQCAKRNRDLPEAWSPVDREIPCALLDWLHFVNA